MNEWKKIPEEYPKNKEKIIMKIWDRKTEKYYYLQATFNDYPDYRGWQFTRPEGTDIIALPEEWKSIEEKTTNPS